MDQSQATHLPRRREPVVLGSRERLDSGSVLLLHEAIAHFVLLARWHRKQAVVGDVCVERRRRVLAAEALERLQEARDLVLVVQVPEELAEHRRVADEVGDLVDRADLWELRSARVRRAMWDAAHGEGMRGVAD